MKICILADGQSIHTKRWCEYFGALGHEMHLISFKPADIPGTTVHHINAGKIDVKGGNWRILLRVTDIKRLLRTIRPDVVHALYATSYGAIGALSGFHPFIVTPLGTDVLISPKRSVIYRLLLRYVFGCADIITSLAPHVRKAIINYGGAQNKVRELIFGVNTDIFNSINRRIPPGKFVVTSTRNFENVYNIPLIIKAVALVKDRIPGLEVHFTGDGSLKNKLIKMVHAYGLDQIVCFQGHITQPVMVELLNKSHVYISVSLSDGNAISVLEAMACGCFLLASDIEANRQWIQDGINGYIVPLNDEAVLAAKILHVYTNYDGLISHAADMSKIILTEKGTLQVNMKRMEGIYTELIKH
ncbi:MAG: glycosyltransferase family 4 protein [Bacteroidetes bacterium]|nr:glycosyltransferase family 4 protein [Bacteroidota bacterium]